MIEPDVEFRGRRYRSISQGMNAVVYEIETTAENASEVVAPIIGDTLQRVYRSIADKHRRSWPTGGFPLGLDRGPFLTKRTGAGLRSIKDSIHVLSKPEIVGTISTGSMTVHETGANIKARGRYMAIPTIYALDAGGQPLRSGPRRWDNTFVRRTTRGSLFIFQRQGSSIRPMYLLKDKVRVPARLGLERTILKALPVFEKKVVEALVRKFS